MVKNYWILFYLSLIGAAVFIVLFALCFIFMKKLFLGKRYGILLLIVASCVSLLISLLCVGKFILCCRDYKYVSNGTYIEETAKVVEFTKTRFDYDGSGKIENRNPKFYLIEKDEYIILNVKDVQLGETYTIRYYPNTKICEIIEN